MKETLPMSHHPSLSPLFLSQSFPVLSNHRSCCVIAKVRHTQTIWEWKNEKNERSSTFSPSPQKKSLQIGVSGSPNAHGCVHTHLALFTKRGPMVYFCGLTFSLPQYIVSIFPCQNTSLTPPPDGGFPFVHGAVYLPRPLSTNVGLFPMFS